MLPRNHPDRIRIAFDDTRLVANAGLLLPVSTWAAEERLCKGMDMSMMAILRDEKKAEGPVEPRTPRAALRSPLRSKRKRVRSETAEGAQAEKGNREVAGGDGSTAVVNGGTAADPPVR